MNITQATVDKIITKAHRSEYGLGEGLTHKQGHLKISTYGFKPTLESLALCLVNGFDDKYDLVSVFAAALEVVSEESKK